MVKSVKRKITKGALSHYTQHKYGTMGSPKSSNGYGDGVSIVPVRNYTIRVTSGEREVKQQFIGYGYFYLIISGNYEVIHKHKYLDFKSYKLERVL
jgi:hypothetical protein